MPNSRSIHDAPQFVSGLIMRPGNGIGLGLHRMCPTRVGNCFESKTIIAVPLLWGGFSRSLSLSHSLSLSPYVHPLPGGGVTRVALSLSRSLGAVARLIPQKALNSQVANQPVDDAPRELGFNCLWLRIQSGHPRVLCGLLIAVIISLHMHRT